MVIVILVNVINNIKLFFILKAGRIPPLTGFLPFMGDFFDWRQILLGGQVCLAAQNQNPFTFLIEEDRMFGYNVRYQITVAFYLTRGEV